MAVSKVLNDEFFNLHLVRADNGNNVFIHALSMSQINSYFRRIKKGQFDIQKIDRRELEVINPSEVHIYNFSKVDKNLSLNSQADFFNLIFKKLKDKADKSSILDIYKELGEEVTDYFNINIEGVTTSTTSTTTTTKNPGKSQSKNRLKPDLEKFQVSGESTKLFADGELEGKSEVEGKLSDATGYSPPIFDGGIVDNEINPTFDVEKIAQVFANHLKNLKDESGQMVGIFGKWGRGKTYFFEETCKFLKMTLL